MQFFYTIGRKTYTVDTQTLLECFWTCHTKVKRELVRFIDGRELEIEFDMPCGKVIVKKKKRNLPYEY